MTSETAANATESAEAKPSGAHHRVNELHLLLAFVDELDETGLFVDVGAHVGSFSSEFAGRGWDVVAVEAAPDIHTELVERLAPFDRAEVVHAAATETGGGEIEFFISSEYWGIHSLKPFHETHDSSVKVPTVRVADLLRDRRRSGPLVLKVDTEGADLLVLRGVDWEADKPRIVLSEFMDERTLPHFGYVYTDIIGFMEERGYVAYVSEWAPVAEPARRGSGGGPFTHVQIVRAPLNHRPAWGNVFFVSPQDVALFESVLQRYLMETRRLNDETVESAAKSLDRLSRLERSIVNREGSIERLKATAASLASRLEAEGERHRTQVGELESAVSQRDSRIARLKARLEQKNERIAELKSVMKERARRYRWRLGLLGAIALGLGITAVIR